MAVSSLTLPVDHVTSASVDDHLAADFTRFVTHHDRVLLGFAQMIAGNRADAEDLVQNALAKAFLRWDRLGSDDFDALAYVRRIIVNDHHSLWRRAFKRREHATEHLPEVGVHDDHPDDELWQQVMGLPPRQRAVIALRYYSDMSVADTAGVLRCTEGTVKSQTSRALATLRGMIEEEGGQA